MTYKLTDAIKVANYLQKVLAPHCDRFHIAGSIRRNKWQVKDIEIVCQPKRQQKEKDLFDTEHIISQDFIEALAPLIKTHIKGNVAGRYMKVITTSKICPGISLDLFLPQPADYFRQLVIRTGSAEYVHNIIAAAWKRKGWVGAGEHGLRRREDCAEKDHNKWILVNQLCELPPVWLSEAEFFDWIGVRYTEPFNREFKPTLNAAQ